jgi:hypothetical protein
MARRLVAILTAARGSSSDKARGLKGGCPTMVDVVQSPYHETDVGASLEWHARLGK